MTLTRRQFLSFAAATGATPANSPLAWAQTYPARPVRVIVPVAAGGPNDVFARLVAQKLSEHLGKHFYVENVGGGGANIGMGRAARAAADGYSMLIVGPNFVVNPALYNNIPYDPIKDFDPVTLAVNTTVVVVVNPSLLVQTVAELIALIRANPGKYSYGSGGVGTAGHLAGELFRQSLGLDLVHVPYNSAGPAIGAAVAGHTPISFVGPAPVVPLVKEGKLRALAVTSKIRSPALPEVPSTTEAGYPGIECDNWYVVLVPSGTPKDIIALLNREIAKAVAVPEVKERLATLGYEPVANTPDECAAQIKADIAKWSNVIRAAGIRAE